MTRCNVCIQGRGSSHGGTLRTGVGYWMLIVPTSGLVSCEAVANVFEERTNTTLLYILPVQCCVGLCVCSPCVCAYCFSFKMVLFAALLRPFCGVSFFLLEQIIRANKISGWFRAVCYLGPVTSEHRRQPSDVDVYYFVYSSLVFFFMIPVLTGSQVLL